MGGALWPSGLERWTDDRVVLGSNPAAATSLRNFGNSVYPALPVPFGGDTKSRQSLLSGVYVGGNKRSHTGGKCVTCRGLHHSYRIATTQRKTLPGTKHGRRRRMTYLLCLYGEDMLELIR